MSAKDKYEYNDAYQKEYIKRVVVKLNRKSEQDIIDYLDNLPEEEKSVQRYIKNLIRKDMK